MNLRPVRVRWGQPCRDKAGCKKEGERTYESTAEVEDLVRMGFVASEAKYSVTARE
jgi:hypothetical protein